MSATLRPVIFAASSRLVLFGQSTALSKSLVEAAMKSLSDPTLVGDVGEPCVEEREVGARIDGQVEHLVLAGFDLAGVDRHRAPRIDEDDPRGGCASPGSCAFFLSSDAP